MLAPLYRLFPSPITLLAVQAALIAASSIPITRLATRIVGRRAAVSAGLAYGMSWGLQSAVDFDFHEVGQVRDESGQGRTMHQPAGVAVPPATAVTIWSLPQRPSRPAVVHMAAVTEGICSTDSWAASAAAIAVHSLGQWAGSEAAPARNSGSGSGSRVRNMGSPARIAA